MWAIPHTLGLRTFVNGEKRQDSNTRFLVFNCFEQVAHLSQAFTLEPGDVIFTGTSAGVAAAMDPPPWLKGGRYRADRDRPHRVHREARWSKRTRRRSWGNPQAGRGPCVRTFKRPVKCLRRR